MHAFLIAFKFFLSAVHSCTTAGLKTYEGGGLHHAINSGITVPKWNQGKKPDRLLLFFACLEKIMCTHPHKPHEKSICVQHHPTSLAPRSGVIYNMRRGCGET